ncbi:MAG: hypothetical protein ACXABI_00510 [Candidatus Hodarchaeales archaeon]
MSPTLRRSKRKPKKISMSDLPVPPSLTNQISSSEANNEFSPPPMLSKDILTRPPLLRESDKLTDDDNTLSNVDDIFSADILQELEDSGFGSDLRSVPPERPIVIVPESLALKQFEEAKGAYLEAGEKHLELNFYPNAACLYSCAILCELISKDVFQAAHLMKDLGTKLPKDLIKNRVFQGVKALLQANLLKNEPLLSKAIELLFHSTNHMYQEDQVLIHRAIRQTEEVLKSA